MEARAAVLRSVAETLLPPLLPPPADEAAANPFFNPLTAALLSSGPPAETPARVLEVVEQRLTPESRRELHLLLRLLGSRLGCLLLLGRASFSAGSWIPSAFADLPLTQREAVLLGWSGSPDARLRKAFKALKGLTMSAALTALGPDATPSPLLAGMRYSITDPARPPAPSTAAAAAEASVAAALVDLSGASAEPGAAAAAGAALAARGMQVAWPGEFSCTATDRERPQLAVQCDVVVVGSGAGGGVAAANLAAAGLRVVVLEKAGFVPAHDMTQQEGESFQHMYEQGGILTSEDGTMAVLAGATLGGGTRINWCASFKTPQHVRREWAEQHGLEAFASPQYDAALEAVCTRLGVGTGVKHGAMCSALRQGLEGLGAHSGEVPRNCLSPECSGHCCFGCARGDKQDTVNTWLADACRAGARIITGAWVERVLLEPNPTASPAEAGSHPRPKRAVGVLAMAGSGTSPLRLVIQAPTVISAAGSIHSPALLLRSRITCRGNVGANLRLHPCTCVVGIFPPSSAAAPAAACGDVEDLAAPPGKAAASSANGTPQEPEPQPQCRLHMGPGGSCSSGSIRGWEGPIMSIFSNQVGDWEGSGYGSLLYTPSVHPGLFATAAPWLGGADFKRLMLQYPNACAVLVLVRDQGSGRVVVDKSGRPRIHYSLDALDAASMLKGMELGLRCMAAAGADTVMTTLNSPAGRFSFADGAQQQLQPGQSEGAGTAGTAAVENGGAASAPSATSAPFEAFLAEVAQTGVVPLQMPLFCAHQMGTCRLGTDPESSALDAAGQCWEAAGLYCCDGSTFPTPTGVNPMITIEAISYMLTVELAAELSGNGHRGGKREAAGAGSGGSAKL